MLHDNSAIKNCDEAEHGLCSCWQKHPNVFTVSVFQNTEGMQGHTAKEKLVACDFVGKTKVMKTHIHIYKYIYIYKYLLISAVQAKTTDQLIYLCI